MGLHVVHYCREFRKKSVRFKNKLFIDGLADFIFPNSKYVFELPFLSLTSLLAINDFIFTTKFFFDGCLSWTKHGVTII